ncbi:MAG: toxin-antitoxin (TA) system antitoxin [Blastochloris sp.]|nr:toxin-antitoxin (TA) system antitoxin [Blastochloris sp.]
MNSLTIDVADAQTKLQELLTLAMQGNEVVIAANQVPLVKLVPVRKRPQRRVAGLHRGALKMRDDFNEPLPDEFWLGKA